MICGSMDDIKYASMQYEDCRSVKEFLEMDMNTCDKLWEDLKEKRRIFDAVMDHHIKLVKGLVQYLFFDMELFMRLWESYRSDNSYCDFERLEESLESHIFQGKKVKVTGLWLVGEDAESFSVHLLADGLALILQVPVVHKLSLENWRWLYEGKLVIFKKDGSPFPEAIASSYDEEELGHMLDNWIVNGKEADE